MVEYSEIVEFSFGGEGVEMQEGCWRSSKTVKDTNNFLMSWKRKNC
jgi:hypothetical protein